MLCDESYDVRFVLFNNPLLEAAQMWACYSKTKRVKVCRQRDSDKAHMPPNLIVSPAFCEQRNHSPNQRLHKRSFVSRGARGCRLGHDPLGNLRETNIRMIG